MQSVRYRGRRAATIETEHVRITVLEGGGHIAEVCDKRSGVNPLWTPHWASIEPGAYDPANHAEYGDGVDASLLAGIMGHNLCLDIFGGPSAEEAAAGMPVHGEMSTVAVELQKTADGLALNALLPLANLRIERAIGIVASAGAGTAIRVRESVHNLGGTDRPIGWTQHVTLGPPFLRKGATEFRASATHSQVFPARIGPDDYLEPGARFEWPSAPRRLGGAADLRRLTDADRSSAYTAHLMDSARDDAFFVAYSPEHRLAFGYVWRRQDFPWMGIWEENHSRRQRPWDGRTLTRGMEFGVSPFPESRREMIERGPLFDVPTFRWLPAASRVSVEYWIVIQPAEHVPETLGRPGQ